MEGWEASILGDILSMTLTGRWDGWNSFLGQGKPRRGRSCICDRQIIARGIHPPRGNQRDTEEWRKERVTEGERDRERQRAGPQSKCLSLAETKLLWDVVVQKVKPRWICTFCLKAGGGWKLTAYPSLFHSLPIQQITSLQALFRKAYIPDYIWL